MPLTDEERRAMDARLVEMFPLYGLYRSRQQSSFRPDDVIAFAASEVERERASIVEWLRGAEARMKAQGEAGAVARHHMHAIGQLAACAAIANAIEKGEHR